MNHIRKLIDNAQQDIGSVLMKASKEMNYEPDGKSDYRCTYIVPLLQDHNQLNVNTKFLQQYYVDLLEEIAELATNKALELHPNVFVNVDSKLLFTKFVYEASSMLAHRDRFYEGFVNKKDPLFNDAGTLRHTEIFLSGSFYIIKLSENHRVLIYKAEVLRVVKAADGTVRAYTLKNMNSRNPDIKTYSYYDYSRANPFVFQISGASILDADASAREEGHDPQRLSCSIGLRYVLVDSSLASTKQLHDHMNKPCEVLKNEGVVYRSRTFDYELDLVKFLYEQLKEDPIHFTDIYFEYPSGATPMVRVEF